MTSDFITVSVITHLSDQLQMKSNLAQIPDK